MKVVIGADHAGFDLKAVIIKYLDNLEIEVDDKGTDSADSVNYPDFAHEVAKSISKNADAIGILICGSANGVCMTANKHKKIRAAVAWRPDVASLAKRHNNANVLCIPARFVTDQKAKVIVSAFLDAEFEGGRHQDRINLI